MYEVACFSGTCSGYSSVSSGYRSKACGQLSFEVHTRSIAVQQQHCCGCTRYLYRYDTCIRELQGTPAMTALGCESN